MNINKDTSDVHQLIENAVRICERSVGIELKLELKAAEHHVHADSGRIQQVFWNLLNNAYKFTPLGGSITIRTSNPAPECVRVEIEDTGRGIDPDVIPKIFNAFEQGDPLAARSFGGLGLGLAISKAIMNAHHGTVTASSAGKGRGSTFTVEMATVPQNRPEPPPANETPRQRSMRALNILLIEDHEFTLKVLTRLLKQLGHQIVTANTVASAMEVINNGHSFDLIISDIGLPDGTGYDVIRHFKTRFNVKGIAVSGYGMPEDIRKSMEAGFDEHLTKPVDLQKLVSTVSQLVN
jgi:CheY-like chemotaxis protein